MKLRNGLILVLCLAVPAGAQLSLQPMITNRGVVNSFTLEPAPVAVSPGSIVRIDGMNIGPLTAVTASGLPLPTSLGSPAVKVAIGGTPAPLFSVSSSQITAQVPLDLAAGVAEVVVEYNGVKSRASRIVISPMSPSLRSLGDTGYGAALTGTATGGAVTLKATGLGGTTPAVASGAAAAAGSTVTPTAATAVFAGGLSATAAVTLSTTRPGEFDVALTPPASVQSGDVVTLRVGSQVANRLTYGTLSAPMTAFLALPSGASDLVALTSSDLRGAYTLANSAKNAEGCWPSYLFDFGKNEARVVSGCPAGTGQNAQSAFVAASEGNAVATLNGTTDVRIFSPERDETSAAVGATVTSLTAGRNNGFSATTAGGSYTIDAAGTVSSAGGGGTASGGTASGGTAPSSGGTAPSSGGTPSGGSAPSQNVDLGGGLTQILATVTSTGTGSTAMVVADSADQPTQARLAVVSSSGTTSIAFPSGWLPLIAPAAQAAGTSSDSTGSSGSSTSGPGTTAGGSSGSSRGAAVTDSVTRAVWVPVRNTDGAHALAGFNLSGGTAWTVAFPSGSYIANCNSRLTLYTPSAAGTVAIPVGTAAQDTVASPCLASGFVVVDASAKSATLAGVPSQGTANVTQGAVAALNDYLYATNAATATKLVVLDMANSGISAISVPSEVPAFSSLTAISSMNSVLALGQNSAAGDKGIVLFNLRQGTARYSAIPDGFAWVQVAGVLPVTRKAVARATNTDTTGSQYVLYDLQSSNLTVIPNPEGVSWVGGVQQATTAQTSTGTSSGTASGDSTTAGGGTAPTGGGTAPTGGGTAPTGGGTAPTGGGTPPSDAGSGGTSGTSSGSTGTTAVSMLGSALESVNAKSNTITAVAFDSAGKQNGVLYVRVP